ncbi:MAG TPA: TonB family protein [Bacteroidales bacterium]|nr:TonB family protein [Bacteroidales bacterium]
MAKDINLNDAEWCDLVFEGRNQSYGAFKMRQTSGKRHVYAFIIGVAFVGFIAILPTLISTVQRLTAKHETMDARTELTDLSKLEDQVKEENIQRAQEAPPPPPLKSTIKFTAPVITDEPIEAGEELQAQEDLSATKTQISVATVQGTDEEKGMDIADLEDHKVVIEEKPVYGVEQMPQYPGGDEELLRFIRDNLKYPAVAAEVGIEGRVTIRFVVSRTGDVTDVTVIRGLDPSCDKEAVRVVKMMPRWIPGRQNGRNVPVYYTLPVVYKLQK